MNEQLRYKRNHVTALIFSFLEQMKVRYPDKKYFGENDLERDFFYKQIVHAGNQALSELEKKEFLSLDIKTLTVIEELFISRMSQLNLNIPVVSEATSAMLSQYPGKIKPNRFTDVWEKTLNETRITLPRDFESMTEKEKNDMVQGWGKEIAKEFTKNYVSMVGINGITTHDLKKLLWEERSSLERAGVAAGGAALEAAINAIANSGKDNKTIMLWVGTASATVKLDKDNNVKEFEGDVDAGPVSVKVEGNVEKNLYEWEARVKKESKNLKLSGTVKDNDDKTVNGEIEFPLWGGKAIIGGGASKNVSGDWIPTGSFGYEGNIDNIINYKADFIQDLNKKGQVNQQIFFELSIPINFRGGSK